MEIVYSSSDLYSELCGISILSLFMNNRHIENMNIHIIDNGISNCNKQKLLDLGMQFNRIIEFVNIDLKTIVKDIDFKRWNVATFGRLFEASIFPNLDKVIHIDCDTIINGKIDDMWDIDLDKYIFAGAWDCVSDNYKSNINLSKEDKYINAGCITLNLKRIREKEYEKKFIKYIDENSQFLTFMDQDVINSCIDDDEKKIIPLKYNSYSIIHFFDYKKLKKIRRYNKYVDEDEFTEAKNNPIIIHFTTCFMEKNRPWIENDCHPLKYKFSYYKENSPWSNKPIWKDNRSFLSKIKGEILIVIAKSPFRFLIGFLHGIFLPKIHYIKKNRSKKYGAN